MSKIVSKQSNDFCKAVDNKLSENKTKIKISFNEQIKKLKEVLGQEELTTLKEAAEKMKEASSLSKDMFQKK